MWVSLGLEELRMKPFIRLLPEYCSVGTGGLDGQPPGQPGYLPFYYGLMHVIMCCRIDC